MGQGYALFRISRRRFSPAFTLWAWVISVTFMLQDERRSMILIRLVVFATTVVICARLTLLAPAHRLQIAAASSQENTGFITRAISVTNSRWAAANGLTDSFAFSHNLGRIFSPSLYAFHPEFFPSEKDQRLKPPPDSFFWNPDISRPDVAQYAAGAARQYFDQHPGTESFSLGINDALIWGESFELLELLKSSGEGVPGRAEDRRGGEAGGRNSIRPESRNSGIPAAGIPNAWFRERPDYSNVVFTFMNRAAAELEKTYPGKYLGALAYYWAENVPSFAVHPQVVAFLTADRSQGYDPDFKREEFELQARWGALRRTEDRGQRADKNDSASGVSPSSVLSSPSSAVPRRLGMYDYLYGGGFLIPRIWTRLLDENLKHAHRSGFTDYYAEAYSNEGLDGPMLWLTARLLQNVDQSREALLDEFYRTHYGDAAEPMRRFFERCETLWMSQPRPAYWLKHYRNESQAVIFPSSECRVLREILDEAVARVSVFQRTEDGGRRTARNEASAFKFEAAGTAAVRRRVKLVADAFGVTERFVAFCVARDRLSRLALGAAQNSRIPEDQNSRIPGGQNSGVARPLEFRTSGIPASEDLTTVLVKYLSARDEFVRYTMELRRSSPTAMRTFNFDDYLKNDPAPMARRILARANQEPTTKNQELLTNAAMTGPLQAARTIASLPYGVALPGPWQSSVEPSQYHSAELTGSEDARVLRISGTKDTSVSQWVRVGAEDGGRRAEDGGGPPEVRNSGIPVARGDASRSLHVARAAVRGHVSPGTIVTLVFTWLNEKQQYVGYSKLRLPDGEWPEFVTLEQAAQPPGSAAWVGIGLRIQNQVRGDWIEAKGFSISLE